MENPVLRVTHLDTQELDESLLSELKQWLAQECFKYAQTDFYQRYRAEIFAALKLALWYHTFYRRTQTVAQSILDWSYAKQSTATAPRLLAHACFYCLNEWAEERLVDVLKTLLVYAYDRVYRVSDAARRNFRKRLDKYVALVKIAFGWLSLLNFLSFLVNGKHLTLWERLLSLKAVYNKTQTIQNYNHEISQKEMLWHAYFSLFKLVDTAFDLNRVYRKLMPQPKPSTSSSSSSIGSTELDNLCAICGQEPTMAHCASDRQQVGACKHVYCYYCLRRSLNETNQRHVCRICLKTVHACEMFFNKNI